MSWERLLADPSWNLGLELCDTDGTVRAGYPFHDGIDYPCTGSAHFAGKHIPCSNPIHQPVLAAAPKEPTP